MAARWKTTSTSLHTAAATPSASRSAFTNSTTPDSRWPLMFSLVPLDRSSTTLMVRAPLATSRSIMCELMNEAPPVTSTRFNCQSINTSWVRSMVSVLMRRETRDRRPKHLGGDQSEAGRAGQLGYFARAQSVQQLGKGGQLHFDLCQVRLDGLGHALGLFGQEDMGPATAAVAVDDEATQRPPGAGRVTGFP